MLTKCNRAYIVDSRLTLTAANFAAQTLKIPLPRVAPYGIEAIIPIVTFTMKANVTSGIVGHGYNNILKRVQVQNIPNAQGKPQTVVDASGAALLQLASNEGLTLDRSTLAAIGANNIPNMVTSGVYRIAYPINLVHPLLTDGLRPRCLLPVFLYGQDPVLQMDFAGATEMSGQADPFSAITVEVLIIRRELPDTMMAKIAAAGGFFSQDILENQLTLAAGLTNTAQKIPISTPGSYTGLQICHLSGGATQTLADLSGTTTGASETEWQIKGAGKDVLESFRMKYLQIINDYSRAVSAYVRPDLSSATYVQNAAGVSQVGYENFGGAITLAATSGPIIGAYSIQNPASVYLDFASDGITDIRELGSLLDTNAYAQNNLDVSLNGYVTTSATTTLASIISLTGRRIFGDLKTLGAQLITGS